MAIPENQLKMRKSNIITCGFYDLQPGLYEQTQVKHKRMFLVISNDNEGLMRWMWIKHEDSSIVQKIFSFRCLSKTMQWTQYKFKKIC